MLKKRWFKVILTLFTVYVLYLGALYSMQRGMVFPGQVRKARVTTETVLATGGQVVALPMGGEAWWYSRDNRHPVVLVFHGNGELIEDWMSQAMAWRDDGLQVMLVEYPGYGRAQGSPSYESILNAAQEAVKEARKRVLASVPFFAFGTSLGTGVASELGAMGMVDAVILVAPYTSLQAMARRRLAPGFLVRDRFDNKSALQKFTGRRLIIHGKNDFQIPWRMGKNLADIAPERTQFHAVPDRGHTSVLDRHCFDLVRRWIQNEVLRHENRGG